jgi:hypothetical protein
MEKMKILKRIEKIFLPLTAICLAGMILVAFTSDKTSVIVVVSPYSATIKESIETYAKQGYYVDELISQDVATSISKDYGKGLSRDIKGDIILVMTNK